MEGSMSINPKADLEDIEAWIKIIKKGEENKIINILNRIAVPYYLFNWKKTNKEWLEILQFKKTQLIEEIRFFSATPPSERFNGFGGKLLLTVRKL